MSPGCAAVPTSLFYMCELDGGGVPFGKKKKKGRRIEQRHEARKGGGSTIHGGRETIRSLCIRRY